MSHPEEHPASASVTGSEAPGHGSVPPSLVSVSVSVSGPAGCLAVSARGPAIRRSLFVRLFWGVLGWFLLFVRLFGCFLLFVCLFRGLWVFCFVCSCVWGFFVFFLFCL